MSSQLLEFTADVVQKRKIAYRISLEIGPIETRIIVYNIIISSFLHGIYLIAHYCKINLKYRIAVNQLTTK